MRRGRALGLAALAACQGVSPLTNKVAVGEEAIVVLVGEGRDGYTDLFAGSPGGGVLHRISFTRDREAMPAVHPGGAAVAFLRRSAEAGDSTTWLVVMNLVNAAEREVILPPGLGDPSRIGWGRDGTTLYVRGAAGLAATQAPPGTLALTLLAAGDPAYATADSATMFLLGEPALARVERCPGAEFACVRADTLPPQPLEAGIAGVFRWGSDSLATIQAEGIGVRPLGGGRARRVTWTTLPAAPREGAYWAPVLSSGAGSPTAFQGLPR